MKVFLSFASPDRSTAEQIQLAILGAGHEVFFDQASLPAGSDYNSRIREYIEQSDVFVYLLSPNSVGGGRYSHSELKFAKAKWEKPWGAVLPVMIHPTEYELIDPYLAAVTILEPRGNVAAEVAAAISEMPGQGSVKAKSPIAAEPQPSRMKYFVYISPTKIEMLYPQVPHSFLDEHSLHGDELPSKCHAVTEYLRQNETLGTIASPRPYISDVVQLKYGVVREYASDIAFFGGSVGDKRFGLIGASASMVGGAESATANHAPYYYTLKFLNQLADSESAEHGQPPYFSFSDAVDIALNALPPHAQECEFIAKMIHEEAGLVVATLIYVAHAE